MRKFGDRCKIWWHASWRCINLTGIACSSPKKTLRNLLGAYLNETPTPCAPTRTHRPSSSESLRTYLWGSIKKERSIIFVVAPLHTHTHTLTRNHLLLHGCSLKTPGSSRIINFHRGVPAKCSCLSWQPCSCPLRHCTIHHTSLDRYACTSWRSAGSSARWGLQAVPLWLSVAPSRTLLLLHTIWGEVIFRIKDVPGSSARPTVCRVRCAATRAALSTESALEISQAHPVTLNLLPCWVVCCKVMSVDILSFWLTLSWTPTKMSLLQVEGVWRALVLEHGFLCRCVAHVFDQTSLCYGRFRCEFWRWLFSHI